MKETGNDSTTDRFSVVSFMCAARITASSSVINTYASRETVTLRLHMLMTNFLADLTMTAYGPSHGGCTNPKNPQRPTKMWVVLASSLKMKSIVVLWRDPPSRLEPSCSRRVCTNADGFVSFLPQETLSGSPCSVFAADEPRSSFHAEQNFGSPDALLALNYR